MENILSLNRKDIQTNEQKKPYEKPEYRLEVNMTFMYDSIQNQEESKYTCRQCSSCHGCR